MEKTLSYEDLLAQNLALETKLGIISAFRGIYERAWTSDIFGMVRINENGIILDINPYGKSLLAQPFSNLLNTSIQEYFHPNQKDEITRIIYATIIERKQTDAIKIHIQSPASKTVIANFECSDYVEGKPLALVLLRDVTEQELFAEELKEKEYFLNQAQKIANFGHFVLDIQTASWTGSPELLRIMGITNKVKTDRELWLALIHPDDRKEMTDYLLHHVIKNKNPFNKEYRLVRPTDGETIWVQGKGELRFNELGDPVKMIGTIQDITDRKTTEAELNASKSLYHDLVETSQDLIWQCDINGNFIFVNHAWQATLGYNTKELVGHHFSEFLGLEQAPIDIAKFSELIKGGVVNSYESVYYHKNGTAVILSLNVKRISNEKGEVTGIRGTARNITDKKKSEQLIREKSEELDRYFNTALDLLSMIDSKGRFIRINPEWEKVLGYSVNELLNKQFMDYVHPDDILKTLDAVKQLKIGNEVLNFINRYRCKNGKYKHIEWRSVQVGEMIYGAARDVSRRIELEESLTQTNKDLQEINAQKDKFLYIIAHDLRNPLHNILGINDLLNNRFKENSAEDNYKLIQLLGDSTHAMYELIENLLNWALSQTGKLTFQPTSVSLNALTQKTIGQVLSMASLKNIRIKNKVPDGVNAWADETMMGTVLRNLISNAVKFSYPDNIVEISLIQKADAVILEIKDCGIGIREQVIEGLFLLENAYLKKGTSGEKGTGFGLPLCRDLMKKQNGNIWAESEPTKGSSFFIELPVKNDNI